jgi:hypothetical protein
MKTTIDMARESGLLTHIPFRSDTEVSVALKAFEALVRADERARAAPVQEPVAWMYPDDYERMTNSETFCTVYSVEVGSATRGESTVALYTTPPAQPAQPAQQEPVARLVWRDGVGFMLHLVDEGRKLPEGNYDLYTSPPAQRTWVGLTKEDIVNCLGEPCWDDVVRKAEAKLKEKNT